MVNLEFAFHVFGCFWVYRNKRIAHALLPFLPRQLILQSLLGGCALQWKSINGKNRSRKRRAKIPLVTWQWEHMNYFLLKPLESGFRLSHGFGVCDFLGNPLRMVWISSIFFGNFAGKLYEQRSQWLVDMTGSNKSNTPWKFKIAPKNRLSQKKSSLPTIIF